jgi:hypothetical protein
MRIYLVLLVISNLLSCSKNQEVATCRKSERGDYYIEASNSYLLIPRDLSYAKIGGTYQKGAINLNNVNFSESHSIVYISSEDFSPVFSIKKDQCVLELWSKIR